MSDNPFNIVGDQLPQGGIPVEKDNAGAPAEDRIKNFVAENEVFLFMKGSPQMPQCGFSANVVAVLDSMAIEYRTFDVLSDMEIRQGIKDFSNWPTIPQLYVKGKFIGGCDIVVEMYQSGDLKELFGK